MVQINPHAVHCSAVQCSTVHYSAVQCGAVEDRSVIVPIRYLRKSLLVDCHPRDTAATLISDCARTFKFHDEMYISHPVLPGLFYKHLCHQFYLINTVFPKPLELELWENVHPLPCTTCHMSCVMCHRCDRCDRSHYLLKNSVSSWWRFCYQRGVPLLFIIWSII